MNDFMPSPYAALSSIFALCPVNALLTSGCTISESRVRLHDSKRLGVPLIEMATKTPRPGSTRDTLAVTLGSPSDGFWRVHAGPL
jgi:outer membrane protein assembly factor BamE (lipoprotein component of BamABCDE complex)